MTSVTVKTPAGKDAGTLHLDAEFFGVQPNVPVMHQVVTAQLAARRAGTQSTKTRAEVSGGGKKPFKQKGTGNARQGSTRAPHFSGGGVALGPKPRTYDQKTPKKMVRLALRSALSDRANEGKIIVVDDWGFTAPKTKDAVAALNKLGIDGKALVVVDVDDTNTIKSFLNLQQVQLIERAELNAYDVLCNEYIVFTKATLPTGASAVAAGEAGPSKPAAAKNAATPADAALAASVQGFADLSGDAADAEAAAPKAVPAGAIAANEDGSSPDEDYVIKGNGDSGLYHRPGTAFYNRTIAEFWFKTAEDAEAAGFLLPPSQRDDKGDQS
jgi:large subunit ribosomal protein L4